MNTVFGDVMLYNMV